MPRTLNLWRDQEIEAIERNLEVKHISAIVKSVQALERRNGWPVRSVRAITDKAQRIAKELNSSLSPVLDDFSFLYLASVLMISKETVASWCARHHLPYRRISRFRKAIKRSDFCRWAYQNEHLLYGKDREGLLFLTDDVEFADRVSKSRHKRNPNSSVVCINLNDPIRIARVDTGKVFNSLSAAAKNSSTTHNALAKHIRKGRSEFESGGVKWRVL